MAGKPYLEWPQDYIKNFLKDKVKRVLFVPYAGVNLSSNGIEESWNIYEKKVAEVYSKMGYEIYSIHHEKNPIKAVQEAEAIAVGGGNTFYLNYMMHKENIIKAIKDKVLQDMYYMGWSAGSNAACPSIKTTNDMPIIEPASFDALSLIPFQINPHYLDAHPQGHGGETRQQRIEEFLAVNKEIYVVGLREACLLEIHNNKIELKGKHPLRIFKYGQEAYEVDKSESLDFLFK